MSRSSRMLAAAALVGAMAVVACTPSGASPAPTNGQSPTPPPSASTSPTQPPTPVPTGALEVRSPAQAAALVFASNDQFAQMTPLRTDMVGQSSWYEAHEDETGFTVVVTMGSGDCQAGCINRHTWTYHVDHDGTIELVGEEGDDIEGGPSPGDGSPISVTVTLVAGPVCPVEQIPPAPNCEPRPVADAEIILRAPDGSEVARGISDAAGVVSFETAEGAYYVEASEVEGIMRVPDAAAFAAVGGDRVGLLLGYDTGIR